MLRMFRKTRTRFPLVLIILCVGIISTANSLAIVQAQTNPWMNTSLTPAQRAAALLAAMTQAEKLAMVSGVSGSGYVGNIPANTRLGIPALNLEDAGAGVADGMSQVTAF